MTVFCHSQPLAFLPCEIGSYDTINSHLSQILTSATLIISAVRFPSSIIKQVVHLVITTFVTYFSVLYFRSACPKLIPIFYQSGDKAKMIMDIGFVNLCKAVTTDDNISN